MQPADALFLSKSIPLPLSQVPGLECVVTIAPSKPRGLGPRPSVQHGYPIRSQACDSLVSEPNNSASMTKTKSNEDLTKQMEQMIQVLHLQGEIDDFKSQMRDEINQ